MSHWTYLDIDTGADEPATVVEIGNYTSNVSRMWFEALGGKSLSDLHGRSAVEALPALDKAVTAMETDPEKYKAMNPPNGWGNYDGALDYLRRLRDGCAQHPKTVVHVSH